MVTLENDFLKINIRNKGAELTSVYNKKTGQELLWQADADVWEWHAPNLFPIVGGLLNNHLRVNDEKYFLGRHGFARNTEFKKIDCNKTHVKYSLHFNQDTLTKYPYKFEFQILYDLMDNQLRVSYKVINLDDKTVYFSVGAHPGFALNFKGNFEDDTYFIAFDKDEETLNASLLNSSGMFDGKTKEINLTNNNLYLNKKTFENDALVFKNLKSRKVHLKNNINNTIITIDFPHFNYLGLWAKPGANFVCIEPWLGCADTADQKVDISKKEGIQHVEKGHVFETEFFIGVRS